MLPAHTKSAIDLYVDKGYPVGSFLYAVLTNDLFEAAARADVFNQQSLTATCKYIYNCTPRTCWGSVEVVKAWLKLHKENPEAAEHAALSDRENRQNYET